MGAGCLSPGARFFLVHSLRLASVEDEELSDEPAAKADCDGMSAGTCLQLGEQVADVRLHRLLRQEQALADLPVHEPVGDELEHLDLAHRRFLLEGARRRLQLDHVGTAAASARRDLLEVTRVREVTTEDLLALGSVHEPGIGAPPLPL
jgi:hypothetical protein